MKISTPIIVFVLVVLLVYFYFTKQVDPAANPEKTGFKGSGASNAVLGGLSGAGATASADWLATNYPKLTNSELAKVRSMAEVLNTNLYSVFPKWNDMIEQAKQLGNGAVAVKGYYNNRYGISINTLLTGWRFKSPLSIKKINELNNYLG